VTSPTAEETVTFGEFEARLGSRELCRNGVRVRLPDQSFQVLAMLLEHRSELVTREEIRQKLWPGDTFVDFDHGLNNAVNRLREALGDSAESPRFVETLPRRGYRFIAPVEENLSQPIATPTAESPAALEGPAEGSRLRGWIVLAASGVLLVAILTISAMHDGKRASASRITSLVVLPLENVSGDPAQEYFSDGMTDTLITDLAELGSVRVISRTSAMHYKGTHKSLPEIAQELNVDAVIEGTVSRAGDRVRINAQLIDARNEGHLWAKAYEQDMRDVLQLQNEVASAIALEVSGRLTNDEASRLGAKPRQVNPQAYEAYLKGRFFLDEWTAVDIEKSKGHFEHAIELDPSFADGYAGLGEYYGSVAIQNMVPPREAWLKAEDLLDKALKMDNTSSKAHTLLGLVKLQFRCDQPAAKKELSRALELNPGDMEALDGHSYYLLEIGHPDEAIAEKKRVLEHDPLSIRTNADLGLYLIHAGHSDEAIAQLEKTLELDPNYVAAHMRLGMAYAQKQEYSLAVTEYQKAIALDKKPRRLERLGDVYARWGKRDEAQEIIGQLQEMSKQQYVSPTGSALIYARLGNRKAAIAMLEKAKPDDDPKITDPGFDSLRLDPRFKTLETRLKPDPSCPAF
jgi:TolB-like protein/DNA-binding winged helix-turn-helix (wHTH) protein/Flp pilus assembly protein TadD